MRNIIKATVFDRIKSKVIYLNISNEICSLYGFKYGDLAINPNQNKVIIKGVALGNDERPKLWYTVIHPTIKRKEVCYWGGKENLIEARFVKIETPRVYKFYVLLFRLWKIIW